jgi:hypothetical protein
MTGRAVAASCLAFFLVACVAGCASRINEANYDKIEPGMTVGEVEDLLGMGQIEESGSLAVPGYNLSAKVMVWRSDSKWIRIIFEDDKVVTKSQMGL